MSLLNDLSGQTIGSYHLVERLGAGGMAEVYKAYQPRLERYVALKFILPHLAAAEGFLPRFEQEAKLLARLNHPHIVHIYDFGEEAGRCYLVMEYVAGGTLKDWLRSRQAPGQAVSPAQLLPIVQQVSAALDYAHQQGIIHRDIKPANLMLTADGRAMLSDFGLAKLVAGPGDLTQTGSISGTPAYMSPEQVLGDPTKIGPVSDLYAWGVVLFELLTGCLPFTAESGLSLMLKHVHEAPPLPRRLNPALSEPLERVLLKALAKEPGERYQRAGDLAQAIVSAVGLTPPLLDPEAAPTLPNLAWWTQPLAEITAPPDEPPPNPYRGLCAFGEEDASLFFGRELFTGQLVESVRQKPLVAVLGPSGSGKSSIVFAGLLPNLRRDGHWLITAFRPGPEPFRALATALLPLLEPALSEVDQLVERRKLSESLSQGQLDLSDLAARLLEKNAPAERLLLVADQFEELYTLCPNPETRRRFLDLLLAAFATPPPSSAFILPSSSLVLTLRADFLTQTLAYRPMADALRQADVKLGPMTPAELRRAIEAPAETQGVSFEPGLVERILAEVSAEPGHLPLLEFALTALWSRQSRRRLTHAAYDAIGRVEGALSRHAEQVFAGLSETQQAGARRVFVQLVRPGEGTEDTRRLAYREELAAADWELAQRLAGARLVVTNQDPVGQETVEVVHEALIRGWQRLNGWMGEDRRFRAWQERLRASLRQWQTSGQDEGGLLRGAPLAEAAAWLAERPGQLSQAELTFIQAGLSLREREAAEREAQHQRELETAHQLAQAAAAREQAEAQRAETQARSATWLRRLSSGLVVALLLALGTTFYALWQSNLANARQLAADSLAAFTQGKYYLATLLALEANKLNPREGGDTLAQIPYHLQYVEAVTLEGHRNSVTALAWQPNGHLLASGSDDGRVIVWDGQSGQLLTILAGHTDQVTSVAWQSDGRYLASGARDGHIIIWDMQSGQQLTTLQGYTDEVWSVAWQPNSNYLASGTKGDSIIIWDTETGQKITTLNVLDGVDSIAWQPDGRRLASGSPGGRVIIWDVQSGQKVMTLTGQTDEVMSVAWQPDGRHLASGSWDGRIIIWDVQSGQKITTMAHTGPVMNVVWQSDGRHLASGSWDGRTIIWDAQSGQQVTTLAGSAQQVYSVAWQPDGRRLASGLEDGRIIIWNTESEQHATTLEGHTGSILSVAWQPDGRRLASGSADGTIIIWDAQSGQQLTTLAGHTDWVWSIAWRPDSRRLASGSADGTIIIWDAQSGQQFTTLKGHSDGVRSVAWQPDGRRLASGSDDGRIIIWDVESGQPLTTLKGHTNWVLNVAWQPDGRRLASGSDDGRIIIWDVESGQPLTTLKGHTNWVWSVAWQPDGHRLASGSEDGLIIIWDVENGQRLITLQGHTIGVRSVAWQPDGRHLASGSRDGLIIIWDVESGQQLITLQGHTGIVWSVVWQPNGYFLASGSDDRKIHLLPKKLIQPPCQWLPYNLSVTEWFNYRGGWAIYHPTCDNLPSSEPGLIYTLQGRLLLIGGVVLTLGLIGLMMWGSFMLVRWMFRKTFSR